MSKRTIRIAPLGGFECTVAEFYELVGDSDEPERTPYPHDPSYEDAVVPCAGDTVCYGPALFIDRNVMRIVIFRVEDSSDIRSCLAVYGRQTGPRRQLRDGSWSVRVTPFSYNEWSQVSERINELAQKHDLLRGDSSHRRNVVALIRNFDDFDSWETTDVSVLHFFAEVE